MSDTSAGTEAAAVLPPGVFDAGGVEADRSPSLAKLATALAKAQGAIRNASRGGTNADLQKRFAALADVLDACRGPLSENGLAVLQPITTCKEGVLVTTWLIHTSGEFLRERLLVPVSVLHSRDGRPVQAWVHALGSAITYGRRYALAAMVGVAAAGEDDDGNAAREAAPDSRRRAAPPPQAKAPGVDAGGEAAPAWKASWAQIKVAWEATGRPQKDLGKFILAKLGKKSPSQLVAEDVVKMAAALAAEPVQTSAPPQAASPPGAGEKPAGGPPPGQHDDVPF